MNSLYTRVFAVFWAAMVIIGAGSVGVTSLVLAERGKQLPRVSADLLQGATLALQGGGEPTLRQWLQTVRDEHPGLRILVIDRHGNDLAGRPVPPWLQRRALGGSSVGPGATLQEPLHAGLMLFGPDGQQYLLAIVPSHRGMDPWTLPEVRVATLLLALIASGIASWWIARSIAWPVRALGEATRDLAQGHLEPRLDPRVSARGDDLGRLGRDFEAMAMRLRTLLRGREQLLRDVSHELRSPLARMRVALGLARQAGADVTTQLQRLDHEVERLDALIGQVLRLSRLDALEDTVLTEPIDLVELVDAIARDGAFEAQARGTTIHWQAPMDRHRVMGNGELLASAVENVVRNAIRYSEAGQTIDITLRALGGSEEISVRDRGPGVPEGELERIFEPFHRVAESRTRDSGGDGIGLAITARVLRAHGGTAFAANGDGGGLVVTLRVPSAVEPKAA